MFRRHVVEQLSAFHHGELLAEESRQVAEHLRDCERCRKRYEEIILGIRFAEELPRLAAPDEVWAGIELRLKQAAQPSVAGELALKTADREGPRFKVRFASALAATGIAIVLVGVFLWIQHWGRLTLEVSLDQYLERIESSPPSEIPTTVSSAPREFIAADKMRALKAANIERASATPPLQESELLTHRIRNIGRFEVVQLVYGRGAEVFSVFVAPEPVNFSFGEREIRGAEIEGIRCRRIDCPRTTVVWFGAGRYHCVLISKVTDLKSISAVIQYFVSAHKGAGESS